MIAVHIKKNSPKKSGAKFSIYFQPTKKKFGISWIKNKEPYMFIINKQVNHWVKWDSRYEPLMKKLF